MKTKKHANFFILFLIFYFTTYSCKDAFDDDFNKEFTKISTIDFEQNGLLKFTLIRAAESDNNGKVVSIIDSLRVTNISGFDMNHLDFSMFFYKNDSFDNNNLLLTFLLSETYGALSLNSNEERRFFIDSNAQISFDQSNILAYILETGGSSDYENSGLFDNSYKYYKYDTLGKEPDDYDTILLETGVASSIADYNGYLTTTPLNSSSINLLNGFIDHESNFLGQFLYDSIKTKTSIAYDVKFPTQEIENTLNTFILQSNTPNDTVFEIQFMNYKK